MTQTSKTGGRKLGTPNRRTLASRRHVRDRADPLDFLAKVMSGVVIDGMKPTMADRLAAARELRRVIVPDAKERPINFQLPSVTGLSELAQAVCATLKAVGEGKITPGEGKAVTDLLEAARKALESADLADRLSALEAGL
jgi:hypothetical protein